MNKTPVPVILLVAALAVGCAHQPGPRGSPPEALDAAEQAAPPATGEVATLEYHVLAGELALQRGLHERAAQEYVAALEHGGEAALAKRATRIALFAEESELAYQAARAWAAGQPESVEAQRTAARLALANGTDKVLQDYAARVIHLDSGGVGAGFRHLAQVFNGEAKHTERALAVMRDLVDAHPELAEAHYARAQLAMRDESYDESQAAIDRALALRSDWRQAALLRAGILVRRGRTDEAQRWIAGLDGSRDERVQTQIAFARMLLDHDRNAVAADAFERALAMDPDNADARYGLAVLALTLGRTERAEKALTRLYEAGNRSNDAAFYLGNIADQRGEYTAARRWYKRVQGGGHQLDARVRAAVMRARTGDVAGARTELQSLRSGHPDQIDRLYLAEGELLLRVNRINAALTLYDRALERRPDDADLLYGRALVHERRGNIDKAAADLRAILEQQPEAPRALNALGYMLSNHSSRYQEALGYIRKALDAQPDDPAVMDSMGWIQYRLGHLEKARDFLSRAYEQFPEPEVAAHYGEVLWQLGRKQKAREIWQKALADSPDHRVLQETVERLAR